MTLPYRFQVGETVVVALAAEGATDADFAGITVTAALKLTLDGGTVPPLSTASVADFDCTYRAAADGVDAGWNLALTPAQTGALASGIYVTNAVLTFDDGTVIKTFPLFLQFDEATQ